MNIQNVERSNKKNKINKTVLGTLDYDHDNISDFDEVIENAIEDEKDGYKLYSDLSRKMDSEESKKAFQLLADEEMKHIETLEKYLNEGPEYFRLPKNIYDKEILFEKIVLTKDANLRDILVFAISEEKKAAKRYQSLAKLSKDKEVHDTFVHLSRMEQSHALRLENIFKDNYSN